MYEKIEALVPAGPYLELFGRVHNRREGWVTAGNEAIEYLKNS
jgi:N6-adenosine-specific RNA methylase IME4